MWSVVCWSVCSFVDDVRCHFSKSKIRFFMKFVMDVQRQYRIRDQGQVQTQNRRNEYLLFKGLKRLKSSIALNRYSHDRAKYGTSPAIWDHTVLPATRHKWTHSALTPASKLVLDLPTRREYPWQSARNQATSQHISWGNVFTGSEYMAIQHHARNQAPPL